MSTAVMVQPSYKQRRRVVNISVLDKDGNHAQGATLAFAIGSEAYGDVTLGDGPASIAIPDSLLTLDVSVEFAGEFQTACLGPGQNKYIFRFLKSVEARGIVTSLARCPDGAVGQPCVDCVINGKVIRICA